MSTLMQLFFAFIGLFVVGSCAAVVLALLQSDLPFAAKLAMTALPFSGMCIVVLSALFARLPSSSEKKFFAIALASRPSDNSEVARWRVARAILFCWLAGGLGLLVFLWMVQTERV